MIGCSTLQLLFLFWRKLMRVRVFLYRRRALLGLLVVLLLLGAVASLVGPALQATGLGNLVRLGSGVAVETVVAIHTPASPGANQPLAEESTTPIPSDPLTAASTVAVLPVRAAALDHATVPLSAVAEAFNCARERAGLAPYVVDGSLTTEATEVAARVQAGGRGPQSGERDWTLTGTLVLDTTAAMEDCAIGGVDLRDVPDLDRATHIGIAIVPLPEPHLVLAVVVGR